MRGVRVILLLGLVLGFAVQAEAYLVDRGGGLIYDTVLNVTWLQDANYAKTSGYDSDGRMNWSQATAWAEFLVYGGYDDWRLAKTDPVNGTNYVYSGNYYNGSYDYGYNISAPGSVYPGSTGSEMAYMYYANLGNKALYAVDGTSPQSGWGLINTSFVDSDTGQAVEFLNVTTDYAYWSTKDTFSPNRSFLFYFYDGQQAAMSNSGTSTRYAWAVRDGDVAPVPIPGAVWLLGSGLVGLVGLRKRLIVTG